MTPIGPADRALLERLCRLTALAAQPYLRQVPLRRHAEADTNDAVVRDKAMDFALDAWGALLRDIRAKAMAVATTTATLPAVRLSSLDELLGPDLLEASSTVRACNRTIALRTSSGAGRPGGADRPG